MLARTRLSLNAIASVVAVLSCGGGGDYVQIVNGFEFEVIAKISDSKGHAEELKIPSKGRVGADLSGEYSVEFVSPQGTIETSTYTFPDKGERKKGCSDYLNVAGSAAILEEDIAFGIGIGGKGTLVMGNSYVNVCPKWGFETTEPPKSVTVEDGTYGVTQTWLHYDGNGDWHATIERLLSLPPAVDDSYRIQAFNLAYAVSKHDPENPRLAPLGPKFMAACDTIQDMFAGVGPPLEGKARQDCLGNTKALFPDA